MVHLKRFNFGFDSELKSRALSGDPDLMDDVPENMRATLRRSYRRHKKRMRFIEVCLGLIARVRAYGLRPTRIEVVRRAQVDNLDGWGEKSFLTKNLKRKRISFEKLLALNKRFDELTGKELFQMSCMEDPGYTGGLPRYKRRGPPKGSKYKKKI